MSTHEGTPRIPPGGRAELGSVNWAIAQLIGRATGGEPPNVFTTLGRHRGLFRRWLLFASGLMPGGRLPRSDSELVILRVAHLNECEYEWHQHARIALAAGLSADQVEQAKTGAAADVFSPRQRLLLGAVDELHGERRIGDQLWAELSAVMSDIELIELCMLAGHYEMLAMTLMSLRVQPDETAVLGPRSAVARALVRRRG